MKKNCFDEKKLLKDFSYLNVLSIGSSDFRWLHSEAWENRHLDYFSEKRNLVYEKISDYPVSYKKNNATPSYRRRITKDFPEARLESQWILEKPLKNAVAWAEVHGFFGRFESFFLQISHADGSISWDNELKDSLSLLVSALFLINKVDLIKIFDPFHNEDIPKLNWGQVQSVWSIKKDFLINVKSMECFAEHKITSIDRPSWWALENAKKDQETLDYILKRIKRMELQLNPKPPARGIFRFFKRYLG